jgi:hypothetical protein
VVEKGSMLAAGVGILALGKELVQQRILGQVLQDMVEGLPRNLKNT